jgi:hypothetical protein
MPSLSPRLRPGPLLRWVLGLSLVVLWPCLGCSPGSPALCALALQDGGCSYHVELHCGDVQPCSGGSVQVLDAGSCVRDAAADIIGCS